MAIAESALREEVEALSRISFLPVLLDVVCLATGMGFAAVARVTEERWIAGAVRDDIGFGLKAGGELPIDSTICHEIRQNETAVIIDHVAHDTQYCDHHTPARYRFSSYISFPILRKDGSFFGTLCAIDPAPAKLNTPSMVNLFTVLSSMIAEYLDGIRTLSPANIAKLQLYAAAELRNTRDDLTTDSAPLSEGTTAQRTAQLSMKLNMLLIAMDPAGAFLG